MKKSFVPDDFIVPIIYKTKYFTIRKLAVLDAEEDYKAVMEAREHILELYPEEYTEGWPEENLTLEQDKKDLKMHEKQFDERTSFAYTVFDCEDKNCLGCVYIDPSENHDAEITMWTRDSAGDELLYKTVKKWIEEDWPFNDTYYPVLEGLYGK